MQLEPTLRRRTARWLPWLVVGAVLLLLYRSVSLDDVLAVLRHLTAVEVVVLIAANALVLLALNGRWWVILKAQGHRLPYLELAGYRLAAFGLSYFTPGPHFGGEPLQVLLVERNQAVPRTAAVAAVTIDKSLELLVNFLFLVAGVLVVVEVGLLAGNARLAAVAFSVLMLLLPLALLGAIWSGKHPLSAWAGWGERLYFVRSRPKWSSGYARVVAGLRQSEQEATDFCRDSADAFLLAFTVSIISWITMLAEYWLMVAFLGVELSAIQLLVTYTAARIAFLLPLPGGLGTLDASLVFSFGALGLDPAVGLSAGLLIHLRNIALGGLGLWWGSRRLHLRA